MSISPRIFSVLPPSLLLAAILWVTPNLTQAATELEGYVPQITTQKLLFDGRYYALVQGAVEDSKVKWPKATECYVKANPSYQVTCGTLAQIGYIDKAKLRIENDQVMRVELLELMQ